MRNTSWKRKTLSLARCVVIAIGAVGLYASFIQSHAASKARNSRHNPEHDRRNNARLQVAASAYKAWRDDNDLVRAESLYHQAIAMDANDVLSWHRLAQVLDAQGKEREALSAYRRTFYPPGNVISSTQDNVAALYRYAQLCDRYGQHDEAMQFYSRVLRVSRQNGDSRYGDLVIAVDTQEPQEIRARASLLAGINASHHGDEAAIPYYQEAIRLKPNLAAAHYVLARTYESYRSGPHGAYHPLEFKTEYALAKRLGGEEVQQAIQRKIDRATQLLERHEASSPFGAPSNRYVDADGEIRGRMWGNQSVRPLESPQAAKAHHAALLAHYLHLQKAENDAFAARAPSTQR